MLGSCSQPFFITFYNTGSITLHKLHNAVRGYQVCLKVTESGLNFYDVIYDRPSPHQRYCSSSLVFSNLNFLGRWDMNNGLVWFLSLGGLFTIWIGSSIIWILRVIEFIIHMCAIVPKSLKIHWIDPNVEYSTCMIKSITNDIKPQTGSLRN